MKEVEAEAVRLLDTVLLPVVDGVNVEVAVPVGLYVCETLAVEEGDGKRLQLLVRDGDLSIVEVEVHVNDGVGWQESVVDGEKDMLQDGFRDRETDRVPLTVRVPLTEVPEGVTLRLAVDDSTGVGVIVGVEEAVRLQRCVQEPVTEGERGPVGVVVALRLCDGILLNVEPVMDPLSVPDGGVSDPVGLRATVQVPESERDTVGDRLRVQVVMDPLTIDRLSGCVCVNVGDLVKVPDGVALRDRVGERGQVSVQDGDAEPVGLVRENVSDALRFVLGVAVGLRVADREGGEMDGRFDEVTLTVAEGCTVGDVLLVQLPVGLMVRLDDAFTESEGGDPDNDRDGLLEGVALLDLDEDGALLLLRLLAVQLSVPD